MDTSCCCNSKMPTAMTNRALGREEDWLANSAARVARKEDAFKAHATIVARSATGGDSAGTCRLLKVVCQDLGRRRARQSEKAKRASRVPKERTVTRGDPKGASKGWNYGGYGVNFGGKGKGYSGKGYANQFCSEGDLPTESPQPMCHLEQDVETFTKPKKVFRSGGARSVSPPPGFQRRNPWSLLEDPEASDCDIPDVCEPDARNWKTPSESTSEGSPWNSLSRSETIINFHFVITNLGI